MAIKILEQKISPTGKRFDFKVLVKPNLLQFFDPFEAKIRVMSYDPIPEPEEESETILQQVIERRKEWRECKQSCSLKLEGYNATAFILETKTIEEE